MFNLDTAISKWRQQMLDAGIKTPVPLEELENHLRDDVEQQVRSGMDPRRAFESAVQRTGQPTALKSEFRKNERAIMKRNVIILLGILAIVTGPAIFLPALALHRDQGTWTGQMIAPTVAGMIIVLVGVGMTFYGSKMRRLKSS